MRDVTHTNMCVRERESSRALARARASGFWCVREYVYIHLSSEGGEGEEEQEKTPMEDCLAASEAWSCFNIYVYVCVHIYMYM